MRGGGRVAERGVLVGDRGRGYLPRERLAGLANYDVPVVADLGDADRKCATVWRVGAVSENGATGDRAAPGRG